MAAFEAQYGPTVGAPSHATIDPINTIVPAFFARICGRNDLVVLRVPKTFVLNCAYHSSWLKIVFYVSFFAGI
jgi:hypothetical protein